MKAPTLAMTLPLRRSERVTPPPAARLLATLLAAVLLLITASPAFALDRRSGDAVLVRAGEVVDDDLLVTGRSVRVDGTVRGDLYAVAETVHVGGTVEGDVIALAADIYIEGQVRGNVRSAGATIHVNGAVDRNVSGAAQALRLGSGGRVSGSWTGAGETMTLMGDVGGALTGAGDTIHLQGRIGRGALLAVDSLTLGPNARIGGDLEYYAEREINLPGNAVAGAVRFHRTEDDGPAQREGMARFFEGVAGFLSVAWLGGSAAVGLIMLRVFPRFVARYLDAIERSPVASFLTGLVALVATLPLAILLGITVIGLPAAIVLAGGYFTGLFVGWLLLAIALGTVLVGLVRRGGTPHLAWAFLLGLLVLHVGTHIPIVGGLIAFIGASFGLGALLNALYRTWRRAEMTGDPPPLAPPPYPPSAPTIAPAM